MRRFRWAMRLPNAVLLLFTGGAMLGLLLLVYQAVEAERVQRDQFAKTTAIIEQLQRVETAALNAETGQRGYLITLDRRYLRPYANGREQIEPALRRLETLLADDPTVRQRELLERIDSLSIAKFAELERTVMLLEDGQLLDARREVLSDEGQQTMEALRRAIAEMRNIERDILTEQARETARIEARVIPLLSMLILLLILAMGMGARLVSRAARAEVEAAQATKLGEARDRADLLARELNHRVKNIFAVILAIVQMSARDRPEAKDVIKTISDRIRALLTAHEVSQGELDKQLASLRALIETTLAPYRSTKLTARVEGPEVLLPANRITPLGLVFHELTTNAVKYGAWAHGGTIDVAWSQVGDTVELTWSESGVAIAGEPERKGFGSLLMDSAARQFDGSVTREFTPDGLIVTITLPHADDAVVHADALASDTRAS